MEDIYPMRTRLGLVESCKVKLSNPQIGRPRTPGTLAKFVIDESGRNGKAGTYKLEETLRTTVRVDEYNAIWFKH